MFAVNTPASNLKYMASALFPSLLLDKKDRPKILPLGEKIIFLLKETGYLHIQGKLIFISNSFLPNNNSILLLQLSRFAVRKVFPSVSYFFSQFLRAGILCREKVVQVRDRRSRICDLFETLFLLERTGKKSNKHLEKL